MAAQNVLRLDPQEIRARRAQGEDIVFVDVRTQAARSIQPEQIPGTHWLSLAMDVSGLYYPATTFGTGVFE